jgi:transposase InsO family protein
MLQDRYTPMDLLAFVPALSLALDPVLAQRDHPGRPWQNGYEESCNGTVRDECLNMHIFYSVAEARIGGMSVRRDDNADAVRLINLFRRRQL